MYERTFRLTSGIAILISHVGLCIFAFILLSGRMEADKLVSTLMILVPVFGVFASVVVNYASENMRGIGRRGSKINPLFLAVFWICYLAHVFLVILIVRSYAFQQFVETPEELQQLVGYVEAAFGFLLGIMVTKSFPQRSA